LLNTLDNYQEINEQKKTNNMHVKISHYLMRQINDQHLEKIIALENIVFANHKIAEQEKLELEKIVMASELNS
jgi:hypothetical protein